MTQKSQTSSPLDFDWKTSISQFEQAYRSTEKNLLEEYFTFLRFESISAHAASREAVRDCANWVKSFIESAAPQGTKGFQVEVWETKGHPCIFAEWNGHGDEQPTVLIYNHYDVQPVDPLPLWNSPPFEPTIRDGNVYARGAQDNKGQCFSALSVIRHLLQQDGTLPVNVKLLIEGEEETGSRGLAEILVEKKERLKSDYLLVLDMGLPGPGIPAVTLGLRGMVCMTLELEGSNQDLHSGVYGGIAYNPNRALAEMIAKTHDDSGRITIPGFYDDVLEFSPEERAQMDFDFDLSVYEKTLGLLPCGGEKGRSPLEAAWARPTLEINGMSGGYSGDGFKTVIPAISQAKISCRLVPNQTPEKIAERVEAFFRAQLPEGIRMKFTLHPGGGVALRTDPNSPLITACSEVFAAVLQQTTKRILCGASVPVIPALAKATEAEVALIGYGLDSDNLHAPNEHYGLDRLRLGFVTIGALLLRLQNSRTAQN